MVSIKKDMVSGSEVYTIKNDTGSIKMFYFYGLDLCLTCDCNDSDVYTMVIGPDDTYFYRLIDELYDSISNSQPFKYLKYDFDNKDLVVPEKGNNSKKLFKDGTIEWHSDDYIYDIGSVLYIKKDAEKYYITLQKSKTHLDRIDPFSDYTVIFGNNSRYSPYNVAFMNMFNKLREYDFFVNQVDIDKYSLKRKGNVRKR